MYIVSQNKSPAGYFKSIVYNSIAFIEYNKTFKLLVKLSCPSIIVNILFYILHWCYEYSYKFYEKGKFIEIISINSSIELILILLALEGISDSTKTLLCIAIGSKKNQVIANSFYAGMIMNVGYIIIISPILLYISKFLLFFGYKKNLAEDLQYLMNFQILHYVFSAINQNLFVYVRSFLVIFPAHLIDLICSILLLIFGFISLFIFHLELLGFAISFIFFHLIRFVLIILYIKKNKLHLFLYEGSIKGTFLKIKELLRLSIPASIDYTCEVLVSECLALYLVKLGKEELVAHFGVQTVYDFCINFPYGLGISLQTLVGNYFGKKNIAKLIQLKKAAIILVVSLSISCSIIAVMLRSIFFTYVIKMKESEEIFSKAILIGIIGFSVNCYIYIQCYFLVGLTMQLESTISSFVGKTMINLIIGIILLKFTNLGVIGLWIASLIGFSTSLVINHWTISKIDYSKLFEKIKID